MGAGAEDDVLLLRAANPGPLTLSGTNTWIAGRDPAWVIDPGPALPDHVAAVRAEVAARGGLGGIALTHRHPDHDEAVEEVRAGGSAPVAAGDGPADVRLDDGAAFGPLRVLATPGHAPGHLAFLLGRAAFTGDAVLGEGSVFVMSDLRGYLASLRRLRALGLAWIGPGHGPRVEDPTAVLDAYLAHRAEREERLVAALADGARTQEELLDRAWADAPAALRPAAALTLEAHLEKLEEEDRLPSGVERRAAA